MTEDNVPDVVFNATGTPPTVRLLPLASFSCTVIVVVLEPLAAIVLVAAVIVVVATLAGPGIKFTVSVSVIVIPFSVAEIVDTPLVVDDVRTIVYVPFPLSITVERVPNVCDGTITAPPVVILLPEPSFN